MHSDASRGLGLQSLGWATGALASVVLAVAHLPFASMQALASAGLTWEFGSPAVLLFQAGLCLAGAWGWLQRRDAFLAFVAVLVAAAQAVLAGVTWPSYAPYLWLLWIGPIPMIIPAGLSLAVRAHRRGQR